MARQFNWIAILNCIEQILFQAKSHKILNKIQSKSLSLTLTLVRSLARGRTRRAKEQRQSWSKHKEGNLRETF